MQNQVNQKTGREIPIGLDEQGQTVFLRNGNARHIVIFGGTASERQQTLRSLAESISSSGISAVLTDTTGKLSGLVSAVPCTLWDLRGISGLPLRTTATELGPLLLAQLLGLNEKQSDLLRVLFRIADDHNLLLIDAKDLKAMLQELMNNASAYEKEYGALPKQTLSAILHAVVSLETDGADDYLFEPAIDVKDFLPCESGEEPAVQTNPDNELDSKRSLPSADTAEDPGTGLMGRIHVLDVRDQEEEPVLYACFLTYLLAELYEGIADSQEGAGCRLVVMIDEARLLPENLSDSLVRRLERILEGLSHKGVLTVFSMPNRESLPEGMAEAFGPALMTVGNVHILMESDSTLSGTELLLSVPRSRISALSSAERTACMTTDPLYEKYHLPFDRDSACEFLRRRGLEESQSDETANAATVTEANSGEAGQKDTGSGKDNSQALEKMAKRAKSSAKSLGNTVAGTVGRQIGKSIGSNFGDFGKTLGGNIGASLGRGIINTLFKS